MIFLEFFLIHCEVAERKKEVEEEKAKAIAEIFRIAQKKNGI